MNTNHYLDRPIQKRFAITPAKTISAAAIKRAAKRKKDKAPAEPKKEKFYATARERRAAEEDPF